MNQPLNEIVFETYSKDLAQQLHQQFFKEDYIVGRQILDFCPVKQINLFLVKLLYEQWYKIVEAPLSPYFDHQHPVVASAHQHYVNTLSQYIKISGEYFLPLLERAIRHMLLIMMHPYQYYVGELGKLKKEISLEKLFEISKYIYIHKAFLQKFIEKWEQHKPVAPLQSAEAISFFKIFFEQHQHLLDPSEKYLQDINEFVPCTLEMFFLKVEGPVFGPTHQLPLLPNEWVEKAQEILAREQSEEDPGQDSLLNGPKGLRNGKIKSLRSIISVSQRFNFIHDLFEGNPTSFNRFLSEVELCESWEVAKELIHMSYENKFSWNTEKGSYQELMRLVEKKFN